MVPACWCSPCYSFMESTVKRFLYLCLCGCLLAGHPITAPATERENLSLLLNQLNQFEFTLQRAEKQASVAPEQRFFFDYPQAYADIRAIRSGVGQYLTPSRAQPQPVLPLAGHYRRENAQ